jgi:hypothetical protein
MRSETLRINTSSEYDASTQNFYDSPASPYSTAPTWRPERASTQSAFSAETWNGPHTPKAESIILPILEDVDEDVGHLVLGSEGEIGNNEWRNVTSSLGVDMHAERLRLEDLVSPTLFSCGSAYKTIHRRLRVNWNEIAIPINQYSIQTLIC